MAKLKSYGRITLGEDNEAKSAGKYNVANALSCPYCDKLITDAIEDPRGVNSPFFKDCGVFLVLVWEIKTHPWKDKTTPLSVQFSPHTASIRPI